MYLIQVLKSGRGLLGLVVVIGFDLSVILAVFGVNVVKVWVVLLDSFHRGFNLLSIFIFFIYILAMFATIGADAVL